MTTGSLPRPPTRMRPRPRSRRFSIFARQLRDGKVKTKSALLALDEALENLADELGQVYDAESVAGHAAGTIRAAASVIGLHALEHQEEAVTLTGTRRLFNALYERLRRVHNERARASRRDE